LPSTTWLLIQQKLAALHRRQRLVQFADLCALLASVLVVLHFLFFTLAWWPGLHTAGLRFALSIWAATALGIALWSATRWRRRDDRVLAALYEKHYPSLNEKLLSTVELAHTRDAHGTPSFIAQLADATARQLSSCAAREVRPLRRPIGTAALAFGMLIAAAAVLALSPRYARFTARFIAAWSEEYAGYTLDVSPGDGWAARGRPATVEVRLILQEDNETLPAEARIVFHETGSTPKRMLMDRAAPDAFVFSWPRLQHDVTYYVEAGELTAGPFHLKAVTPIELATAPAVHIEPPPYVNSRYMPAQTVNGVGPFTALQHGRIRVDLHFSESPVRVTLSVTDPSSHGPVAERAIPTGPGDGTSIDLPSERVGTRVAYLRMEGGHGIVTTHALPAWTIRADSPPRFVQPLQIQGVRQRVLHERQHVVATEEPLRVQAAIADTEGLSRIVLEYRINDGPIVAVPWVVADGQLHVAIDRVLTWPKELKEGDRYRFRLCAADNREMTQPEPLGPQIAYSPAASSGEERWIDVRIGKSAESLLRQEIAVQHGELEQKLEQVRQKLHKEHGLLGQVRQASHQQAEIRPAQLQQLAEGERLNHAAVEALNHLAATLGDVPDLVPVGDHLLAIAETELALAAEAIMRFQLPQRSTAERQKDAQSAEDAVLQALKKLNELGTLAERLAQDRVDRLEMERLALMERELADRVDELLVMGDSANAAETLAKLRAEQERIAQRLRELAQTSDMLREASAQMEQGMAQQLAERAAQLAKEQQLSMQGGSEKAGGAGAPKHAEKMLEKMQQLAEDTLKLSQAGGGPESKMMAKEAAHATDQARQAMAKSLAEKAQNKLVEAKTMEAEALLKLEIARKNLDGLAGKMAAPGVAKINTAAALTQGQKMIQSAQQKLQAQPAQAPRAMRQAAGALEQAAQQMTQQLGQALPKAAGRPAVGAGGVGRSGRLALPAPLVKQLEAYQGKSWGELPGELKTQLLQAARAQFGEDYAPIIQQYFEQLAGTDRPARTPAAGKQP
jgi:hypothetical protein